MESQQNTYGNGVWLGHDITFLELPVHARQQLLRFGSCFGTSRLGPGVNNRVVRILVRLNVQVLKVLHPGEDLLRPDGGNLFARSCPGIDDSIENTRGRHFSTLVNMFRLVSFKT